MSIRPFLKGGFTAQLYNALGQIPGINQTISMNALTRTGTRKLVSPRAGLRMAWAEIPYSPGVPPEDESLTTAGELLELGLMAALVDVPLDDLQFNQIAVRGAVMLADLPGMMTARGPEGLFRLNANDAYSRVSPLLASSWPTGWNRSSFNAVQRTGAYGFTASTYDAIQAGTVPSPQTVAAQVHLETGRDLASFVHQDQPFLIPLAVSAQRSRPETLWVDAVAGRLHPEFLARGQWLVDLVGPYLPMIYAEGSPLHPDTPSGHAVLAGVGFTLLKAWFADGPVPNLGVTALHRELDSVAWSMSVGRAWAGIHTRSSLIHGLRLGEAYAVRQLRYRSIEPLMPATFIGFAGQSITV